MKINYIQIMIKIDRDIKCHKRLTHLLQYGYDYDETKL